MKCFVYSRVIWAKKATQSSFSKFEKLKWAETKCSPAHFGRNTFNKWSGIHVWYLSTCMVTIIVRTCPKPSCWSKILVSGLWIPYFRFRIPCSEFWVQVAFWLTLLCGILGGDPPYWTKTGVSAKRTLTGFDLRLSLVARLMIEDFFWLCNHYKNVTTTAWNNVL